MIADHADRVLHPEVLAFLDDFDFSRRPVRMPKQRLDHWRRRLAVAPVGPREQLATDLVAVALRLCREAPGETGDAVRQIDELVQAVITWREPDPDRVKKAQKFLGR